MTPFGTYLEALRRGRSLHQNELASKLGISSCYISAIERGKKGPPSNDVLQKIKIALSLNISESQMLDLMARQSLRNIKLPDNTSHDEYIFMHSLKDCVGSLCKEQIDAMKLILELGKKGAWKNQVFEMSSNNSHVAARKQSTTEQ